MGDGPDSDSESLSGYVFHLSSPEPELEFKEDESLAEELPTTQSSTRESEEVKKWGIICNLALNVLFVSYKILIHL